MRTYAMIAVGLSVGSAAIALVGDKARALATVAPPAPFEISGTVTDASGAPVRGAFVTVADEQSAISRLTDSNGAYRIVVPYPAEFSLSASRFGFATQSVTLTSKDNGTRSFRLSPEFDRTQLTSAQITSFLPKNTETDWLKARCVGCHGMTEPEQFRGSDEGVFDSILRNMQLSYGITFLHDPDLKYAAKLTTKYFGKDAPPSLETVKSRPVDQEALKATIFTINLRNTDRRGLPHSIVADRKGGAWIAVPGNNEITHWDFESGKLSSVAMPKPVSMPHTPTLDRTGRVWTGMPGARQMSVITPGTNDVRYVDLESVPHTLSTDADGIIWGNGSKVYRVDPATDKVTYWQPIDVTPGPRSWVARGATPGQPVPRRGPPMLITRFVMRRGSSGIRCSRQAA
ncbi:carboxypeptidase-like regulatory domain-containing protein [Sphingopyxis sp.]|uniref:carboxypeptidase-like regulatory domain-containing protein n=1 Tax=Sphingopyxis sp. TaxID=1908224 RepID=UPI0025CDDD75|nr:carboxypeptidase-like regulatory domain-containing protein [Sphingopyxis sp.]MBK6413226.1 carboxypeptidase regulatory-like domain-containing protein [Sphingopyxis sp.]